MAASKLVINTVEIQCLVKIVGAKTREGKGPGTSTCSE